MTVVNDSGEQLPRQITIRLDHDHSAAWSQRGDSGSLVLTPEDRVVGLHWGGFNGVLGYANPIHEVEQVLGVTVAFAPVVTGMAPAAGWAGPLAGPVTLTGQGFQGGSLVPGFTQPQVLFGGKLATIAVATDDQIVVTPPLELFATTVDVVVRFGWEASSPVPFAYETLPVIAAVSPAQGSSAGGDTVTIVGAGLAGLHRVTFGGTDAQVTSVTDTQVEVVSPAAPGFPGPADVAVVKDAGRSAPWFGAQFTYL
jgi:hypothetical protein